LKIFLLTLYESTIALLAISFANEMGTERRFICA